MSDNCFFFEILDFEKVRIDTFTIYIQLEIRKVIIVGLYVYDLSFESQPSRSSDLFQLFWDPWPQKCQNGHHGQLCLIITILVMNRQVEGSLTLNFKVIRQSHVIYFKLLEFYDLNYVENDTNVITLSHLHQKISRLTNNGKTVLQCILTTVMDIWRHDICHVTASRWCRICQNNNMSPISSNRYDQAIFAIRIIK